MVNKLKKDKVQRTSIIKITGHKNIQSIDDYDEADEDEQNELSLAISKRNNNPQIIVTTAQPQQRFQSGTLQYSKQITTSSQVLQNHPQNVPFDFPQLLATSGKSALNHNLFQNCQVSFNFGPNSSANASGECKENQQEKQQLP